MNLNRVASLAMCKRIVVALVFLFLTSPAAGSAELFYDDFSRFPPGWLSTLIGQLNGAIQEVHYLPDRGVPLGPWANVTFHHKWEMENGK